MGVISEHFESRFCLERHPITPERLGSFSICRLYKFFGISKGGSPFALGPTDHSSRTLPPKSQSAFAKKKPTGWLASTLSSRHCGTAQLEALSFFELEPLLTAESVPGFESSFFELASVFTVESVAGFESSFLVLLALLA